MRERRFLEQIYRESDSNDKLDTDYIFCQLRNKTNRKYGGHPDWLGEDLTLPKLIEMHYKVKQ